MKPEEDKNQLGICVICKNNGQEVPIKEGLDICDFCLNESMKNNEKVLVKCSNCGIEAVAFIPEQMAYPYTCGNCEKCSMEYLGNLEEITAQRNKWNRRISTLKKAQFKH